jgi:hypothetical protein
MKMEKFNLWASLNLWVFLGFRLCSHASRLPDHSECGRSRKASEFFQ